MIPIKPSNVTWTDEQWQAIYEDNCNIIVSAGAGSGKTAILTERVIRKLKDGVLINQLLILTFTKAAANEMKDRIRKKIKKENDLLDNLNLLDSAYITTFDSFALSVVKRYHYLLNQSPNINVIDQGLISIKKRQVMDEIFLEYYEDGNDLFLEMINSFCYKDDTNLRDYFLNISNQLDLLSNKEEYLNRYLSVFFSDEKISRDILEYVDLIRDKVKSIFDKVKEISYEDSEFAIKLEDSLSLLHDFSSYDDLCTRLNVKLPNAPRGSSDKVKSKKKEISEVIKEVQELACYQDENEIRESIQKTYSTIQIMIEIILKFTDRIHQYKEENASYEFHDIAIMAIDIVKNFKVAREELKNQFKEIMIDEYQDTNDLQEEFISLISCDNTYMVGDIKQSIYRFRNANPYIFKDKYDSYSVSNVDKKIDLNKNFRSRSEVLDNINTIFNLVMNDTIGGADYLSSHQMMFGNQNYLKDKVNHSNDMEIWNYSYDKDMGYTKEEIEAFMIALDIKDKIDHHYQIFDKDMSILRDARYEDFAIIMDRSSSFDLYKKIFNYFHIPITLLKDEKMNDDDDIWVLCNLIRILLKVKNHEIDREFGYLFTSISRSFLCQLSDEEIFLYVKNKNYRDSILYQKCLEISKVLDYITISDLIDMIIREFHYFEQYITIGNIEAGIVKITKIKDTALSLENLGYTIQDFSNYLVELLKNDYVIDYRSSDTGRSSVKVMTIHKSKGLEYSVCYFSGLYKKFNISDLKERFLFDKKYGFVVPYFDEGIGMTIYKSLLKKNYILEEVSEKIRLFYVALTRAREKMILVCPMEDVIDSDSNCTVLDDSVKVNYRSFLDILFSVSFRIRDKIIYKDINNIGLSKDYNILKKISYEKDSDLSIDRLEVTEISLMEEKMEKEHFSKRQMKLISKEERKVMDFGIKIHEYLEYLDFKNPCFDDIDDVFCRNKIEKFIQSDFLKNVDKAVVYQEYEFIYEKDNVEYHGIIDLMLEYDEHIDIVDYKLKNIDDDAYDKQLRGYYDYISSISQKNIHLYLYSILDEKISKMI